MVFFSHYPWGRAWLEADEVGRGELADVDVRVALVVGVEVHAIGRDRVAHPHVDALARGVLEPNQLPALAREEDRRHARGARDLHPLHAVELEQVAGLAGGVGVVAIMMISVTERTREIGVRKALGATPWSIISLVLLESVLITGVAGYFGLVLGVGLLEGVSFILETLNIDLPVFQRPEVDFRTAVIALLLLVGIGTVEIGRAHV